MSRGDAPNDENVAQTSCLQFKSVQVGSLRYGIFVIIFFMSVQNEIPL